MKICSKCKKEKLLTSFYKRSKSKPGYASWCKVCDNSRRTKRQTMNVLRAKVFDVLGSKCVHCGFSDRRALQIDHINGGGNLERKSLGDYQLMKRISLGMTDGYQTLCANCNCIKRIEAGEHRSAV